MATYKWNLYKKEDAVKGKLVGIHISGQDDNLSLTGRLQETNNTGIYRLVINGYDMEVVGDGYITKCTPTPPDGAEWIGTKLMMPEVIMGNDSAVGTSFTRAGNTSAGEPEEVEVDLSEMQPRDYFAVHALRAMLAQAKNPETFDDATRLYYSRAAYKWAQTMIKAAIGSRSEAGEPEPTPEPGDSLVTFVLQNQCGREVRLSGRSYIHITTGSTTDWASAVQVASNMHGPTKGSSWAWNDISIQDGGTYTWKASIPNRYLSGNYYFMSTDKDTNNPAIYLYSRIWRRSTGETEGSTGIYRVYPLQNTILAENGTYTLVLYSVSPRATLDPDQTGDYVILDLGKENL